MLSRCDATSVALNEIGGAMTLVQAIEILGDFVEKEGDEVTREALRMILVESAPSAAHNTQSAAELERVRNGAAQIAANMEGAFPDGHFSAEIPWLSIKEWARQLRAL
jgi:hypothetical protein